MVVLDKMWRENKAIGDQAETTVKFLIESTPNWKCIPYGIENHITQLKDLLKNNHKEKISRRIRSMPDFIAVNTKTNQLLTVDVKYRSFIDKREPNTALYSFSYGQIKDYLDFWKDIHLIVVHTFQPYFSVIPIKDIKWHKHFHGRIKPNNRLIEQWNFINIEKNIKYLFPNLPEEALQKAIEMIPGKK